MKSHNQFQYVLIFLLDSSTFLAILENCDEECFNLLTQIINNVTDGNFTISGEVLGKFLLRCFDFSSALLTLFSFIGQCRLGHDWQFFMYITDLHTSIHCKTSENEEVFRQSCLV